MNKHGAILARHWRLQYFPYLRSQIARTGIGLKVFPPTEKSSYLKTARPSKSIAQTQLIPRFGCQQRTLWCVTESSSIPMTAKPLKLSGFSDMANISFKTNGFAAA